MQAIINKLVENLKQEDWVDRIAGICQIYKRETDGAGSQDYPIACGLTEKDCLDGEYAWLVPSTKYYSTIFFIETSAMEKVGPEWHQNFQMFVWLNHNKMGLVEPCGINPLVFTKHLARFTDRTIAQSIEFDNIKVADSITKNKAFERFGVTQKLLLAPYSGYVINFRVKANLYCADTINVGESIVCRSYEESPGEPGGGVGGGCFKTYDTFAEFPLEGSIMHLYFDRSTKTFYTWTGFEYEAVPSGSGCCYLEFDELANFPAPGQDGILYCDESTNLLYRWSGAEYELVGDGAGGGSSITMYSLTEADTGMKWIDNRPIYVRGVTFDNNSNFVQLDGLPDSRAVDSGLDSGPDVTIVNHKIHYECAGCLVEYQVWEGNQNNDNYSLAIDFFMSKGQIKNGNWFIYYVKNT